MMNFSDLDDDREGINHENAPQTIILPTQDLIFAFRNETDYAVSMDDMKEIITQIFAYLINQPIHAVDGLNALPQVDRMIDKRFFSDADFVEKVRKATAHLGFALYERLKEHRAYYEGHFSYIFDRFVNWDLILTNIPY